MTFHTKVCKIFLLLFVALFPSYGQTIDVEKIDRKDLSKYVRKLSSSEFEGRQTGTIGSEKTAQFIAQKFKELGLLPIASESYLQPFTLTKRYFGESYIEINNRKITNFGEYVASNTTDIPTVINKNVVFGGTGIPEELDKIDVKDKVVLIFSSSMRNTFKLNEELKKRGAFGFMVANPENNERFEQHRYATSYLLRPKIYNPKSRTIPLPNFINVSFLPEFALSNSAASSVMGMSISKLQNYIKNGNIGDVPTKTVRILHRKEIEEFTENNVVGYIKGESSRAIVISAHFDHLGKRGDTFFPGADDNASGIAALLELAETFSDENKPRYSLIFLAAAAEEDGLLGSNHFVDTNISGVTDSIFLNINIDMLGRNDWQTENSEKNLFYFTAKDLDEDLVKLFKTADALFPTCDMIYQSPEIEQHFSRSDQFNFYAKGIPAVHIFSGLHDDYHKTTDTPEKIDYKKLTERVQLIARAIELIQREYVVE